MPIKSPTDIILQDYVIPTLEHRDVTVTGLRAAQALIKAKINEGFLNPLNAKVVDVRERIERAIEALTIQQRSPATVTKPAPPRRGRKRKQLSTTERLLAMDNAAPHLPESKRPPLGDPDTAILFRRS